MKIRNMAVAAALFVGLAQLVGAANAQTKIYVVDEAKIRAESKIGQDIASKLAGIKSEMVAKLGLEPLQKEIKTEDDALKPQVASLSKEALAANPTLKARVEALNKKTDEFMQKAEVLNQNLDQQQQGAMGRFYQALGPAVDYVGKETGADIVLSSSATLYAKNSVDISAKVIARLDATTPTLASLPQPTAPAGGAPGAPGAPAPAAPAKAPAKPAKPAP